MRKIFIRSVLMSILLIFIVGCSDDNSLASSDVSEKDKETITNEIKGELAKFYDYGEKMIVDSITAFFSPDSQSVRLLNGTYLSKEEFQALLSSEYTKRKSQKYEFEDFVIKVLSKNIVMSITKKQIFYEHTELGNTIRYTTENMLWKKVDGKWVIDIYDGLTSKLPDENLKKEIENSVSNFAAELNKTEIQKDSIFSQIKAFLNNNPKIIGTAIALQSPEKYCPYVYRENDTLKEVIFSENEFTNADWFKNPVQEKKNMWSNQYFDAPGCKNLIITFSVLIKKPNSEDIIGVVTGDLLVGQ